MQIIGVIDLMSSRAVGARGGVRHRYEPVAAAGGTRIAGDALALAAAYTNDFGLTALYAADLDAIAGREMQESVVRALAARAPLWLDAAISSPGEALRAVALGAARTVVGLETLGSFEALESICNVLGARVVFGLDLRDGRPEAHAGLVPPDRPEEVARLAAGCGVGAIAVVDLARVGTGLGPDVDLIGRIRDAAPATTLIAGGGVRDLGDLKRLARAGCDGALVARALQDGTLDAAGVAAARRLNDHENVTR